jgi:hypothetical protein
MKPLSNKNTTTNTLLIVFLLLLVLLPNITFAQGGPLQSVLWGIVTSIGGVFAWIGGALLDFSINNLVIGYGYYFATSGVGVAVDQLWTIVRDIFNLTFIFGLIYIGLKMILNSGDTGAKKMLASLVIAALLVNFSLFITKAIVDFSHITTAQIASAFIDTTTSELRYDVSGAFMRAIGFQSIFDNPAAQIAGSDSASYGYIFGTFFVLMTAAFVFAAGGFLLVIRFAVLTFLLILSPLMFLGMVFPGLSGISSTYWRTFLNRAMFAPAYILMLYFSYQILFTVRAQMANDASIRSLGGMFNPSNATAASETFSGVFMFFILACVFLVLSIVVGQKLGAEGANSAMAIGKRITGRARKIATGAVGWAPRKAINYGGEKALDKFERSQARSGAKSITRWSWVDKSVRATTGAAAGAKLGTGTTNKESREYSEKLQARASQKKAELDREVSFGKSYETTTSKNTESVESLTEALENMSKQMRAMTRDEKAGLGIDKLKNQSVAVNISDDDLKHFETSGKFSLAQIQEIKDARKKGYESIATNGHTIDTSKLAANAIDRRSSLVAGKSTKDVGSLSADVFKQSSMYAHITPDMLNEKIKNGGLSEDERREVVRAIDTYLQTANEPTLKSWRKWSDENTNGIKMGISVPRSNQQTPPSTQNNPLSADGHVLNSSGIAVPNNVGGGARPRT